MMERGLGLRCLGFRVWGLVCKVRGLRCRVWGLGLLLPAIPKASRYSTIFGIKAPNTILQKEFWVLFLYSM